MSELVTKAQAWAHAAHDSINQKRKYGDEVYWVHTDAVADILKEAGESEEVQAAGHLHDVLEDVAPKNPTYSEENMRKEFGDVVTNLVLEVTNVYTKEAFPHLNRAKRKHLEEKRIGTISLGGKNIKCADITHNIKGILTYDTEFGKVFLAEKSVALTQLTNANPVLYKMVTRAVADEIAKLKKL
jgi:(p)ppGpp synthase/HD superfamily hydrolase